MSSFSQILTGLILAVGSKNPVKVQAVKNALGDEEILLIPCSVPSRVREQPLSDEETLQGAINRAKNCLEITNAHAAIGLEGGIHFIAGQPYLCHWGALVDRKGNVYFTNSPILLLPRDYYAPLLAGENLDTIMHQTTGIENLGTREGAVGVFTQNRVNREQLLTQMVKLLMGEYHYYQSGKVE